MTKKKVKPGNDNEKVKPEDGNEEVKSGDDEEKECYSRSSLSFLFLSVIPAKAGIHRSPG